MSAAEIIAELPKLTPEAREVIAARLRDLIERDDLDWLEQATAQVFRDLDKREEEDARRNVSRRDT